MSVVFIVALSVISGCCSESKQHNQKKLDKYKGRSLSHCVLERFAGIIFKINGLQFGC